MGQRAIRRREEIQDRLMRQRQARIELQERAHQKKNLAVQTKMRGARRERPKTVAGTGIDGSRRWSG